MEKQETETDTESGNRHGESAGEVSATSTTNNVDNLASFFATF